MERFTLGIKVLQAETQCEKVQGNLSLEVKNEIERRFQRRETIPLCLVDTCKHEKQERGTLKDTSSRMVEQVYSAFIFGYERWSCCGAILERTGGWKTKAMRRLLRCKKGG